MKRAALSDPGVERLLQSYHPRSDVPDELLAPDGSVRPVWREFIRQLSSITADEAIVRARRGDQYLRDVGVFHRQYGAMGAERDWPLSHVPVLLDEAEWPALCAGLIQRADLLEALIGDIYGANRMVADGHLPPELVAQSPGWQRPMVGIRPRGGHFLHFIAFDIGRGPRGEWWVLSDRTEAPSGAGFALENRIATSLVFADIYARANVHRVAGFFRAFRDTLMALRDNDGDRIGILTPGTLNDTYYEHAYMARYLGFMLLTGQDLTVRDGALMVRTVEGLSPISVLWRRMDSGWTDPLELIERSQLGTPGLLGAVRSGQLLSVNALGSGVLETRALLAFMPRLSQALRGEDLLLPNIATWWCGQQAEREHVIANAGRMTIAPALSNRLPFDLEEAAAVGGRFRGPHGAATIAEWVEQEKGALVGQEAVTLSTTPALIDGALVPRPLTLRIYLARTQDGWTVMPGGFARVGSADAPEAVALQQGGAVADVWLVSKKPVSRDTMVQPSSPEARRQPNVLPSRAADNLFWLGRYVERAESATRLLRAWHARLADSGDNPDELVDYLASMLSRPGVELEAVPHSLLSTLDAALGSASHVRDRFSVDGWMALNDLARTARDMAEKVTKGDDGLRAMSVIIRKITGFSGLVHENMYHASGWRFLSLGRSLERGLNTSQMLAALADVRAPSGALAVAVEVGDSVMTHRRSFSVDVTRATVIDLLALDRLNPRAIIYQLDAMRERLDEIQAAGAHQPASAIDRLLLPLQTRLAVMRPEELDNAALRAIAGDIGKLSGLITETFLS